MAMKIQHSRMTARRKVGAIIVVAILAAVAVLVYTWQNQAPGISEADTPQVAVQAPEEPEQPEASLTTIDRQSPVRLKIASIGVDAPIIPVGTEPDGAMAAPKTATDIGWYERSATLGSTKRSVLLSGHYGLDIPEVLRRLNELKKGDSIALAGAAGDSATYKVVETERQHRSEVDMEKAFNYAKGQESLSIITCIGEYDYSAQTYDDRYIVYAVRVE